MPQAPREPDSVPARSLEPEAAAMRERSLLALDRIVSHLESLPDQPAGYDAGRVVPAARALVQEEPPEAGRPFREILDLIFDRAVPESFNAAGPGYMAYIPGGGLFDSALSEFIAAAVNRYTGVWLAAPLLVELESNVLRWFARIVGYPRQARGILLSGGSLANLTAIHTARAEKLGERFEDGVILVGEHAHHCIAKAAWITGFRADQVVTVPSDEGHRMDLGALETRLAEQRALGRRPFLVVANAGSTDTGAVDDLAGLADIAAREALWLHVDGAYGGFFCLTERGRAALAGIERADSVVLDPHKSFFLPYGTGALLVRDGEALRRAHHTRAHYMPAFQDEDEDWQRLDFCEHGPELSRGYRGLGVWLPVTLHGLATFRASLDEKLDLARRAAEGIAAIPGLRVVSPPTLSVLAFRFEPEGLDDEAADHATQDLLDRVLARGRVWLTTTRLLGRLVIRVAVLNFRTHQDRVDEMLETLREEARALIESEGRGSCTST